VSFKKAVRELKHFNGVVEAVSEIELMDWKAQIDSLGISICPNSAVAVSGAMKLRDNGMIKKDEDVIAILTAHGSKFSNTAVQYHSDNTNQFANKMSIINPTIDELEKILEL
jgi:threonine synthase